MNNFISISDVVPCARRQMNLFYLIDCSGSMRGNKIEAINQNMPEIMRMIAEIDDSNKDNAQIKVSCLEFATGVQWKYPEPVAASEFKWQDIVAGGSTDMGAAFRELKNQMSRTKFLASETGHYAPAVILLSDGQPNDDWESALKDLKTNKWFNAAIKVAIAIGESAEQEPLRAFTGDEEMIITVHSLDALKNVIKVMSRGVSQIGSNSSSVGTKSKQDEVAQLIDEAVKETENAENVNNPQKNPLDDWD